MGRSLTVWIDPLDAPASLQAAVDNAKYQARSISVGARVYAPSLLLPTHYGPWPQAACQQDLPPDLLVGDDASVISTIRAEIEAQGVGFGCWGVPLNNTSANLAAAHASLGGYYVANFEPSAAFWAPGDNAAQLERWWRDFWDRLPDQEMLNGNIGVTLIPNSWGMRAFANSLGALLGGANRVLLEAYGGPNTPSYPYPDLWPVPSVQMLHDAGVTLPVSCILSNVNLRDQAAQANRLGSGVVHSWYCR